MGRIIRLTESELIDLISDIIKEQEEVVDINSILTIIKKHPSVSKDFKKCQQELGITQNPIGMTGPFTSIMPPDDEKMKEWFKKMNQDMKRLMDCVKKKRPEIFKK